MSGLQAAALGVYQRHCPETSANGPCAIRFTVHGRVRVEAHSGGLLQPFIKKSGSVPRLPVSRVAILRQAGERATIGMGSDISRVVRLAPGGVAFVGAVAAAAGENDQMEIFGLDAGGPRASPHGERGGG